MTNIWKLLPLEPMQQAQVVWRKLEDGREESCLVTAEEYLAWLAEGNTPLPAENT
jgi:hypothetical protein